MIEIAATSSTRNRSLRCSLLSGSGTLSDKSIWADSRSASELSIRRLVPWSLCSESPDLGTDRAHRLDHVPVWDRNLVWTAVLRGHDRQCRHQSNMRVRRSHGVTSGRIGTGRSLQDQIGTRSNFAGSMTSTATLQAGLDVMKNSEPSVGYSIAYPFGVIGPILCIYFMTRQVKQFPPQAQRFHMGRSRSDPTVRAHPRRHQQGFARWHSGHDGSQGAPEYRSFGGYHPRNRRWLDGCC